MNAPNPIRPSSVFISYSRKDKKFVNRLRGALGGKGRRIWLDQQEMPPSAEWLDETYRGIEGADVFVCVISPDALGSELCHWELLHASCYGKRIVTLQHKRVSKERMPEQLNYHPSVDFFGGVSTFDADVMRLAEIIDSDAEYVHQHTRLLKQALGWSRSGKRRWLLLDTPDLCMAYKWLQQEQEQPPPNALHRNYIETSWRAHKDIRRRVLVSCMFMALIFLMLSITGSQTAVIASVVLLLLVVASESLQVSPSQSREASSKLPL